MGFWNNVKHLLTTNPQQKAETAGWEGQGFHFSNWANSNFFGTHTISYVTMKKYLVLLVG